MSVWRAPRTAAPPQSPDPDAEIPVLVVCATLYFVCWYFTAGFTVRASRSGQVYLQMIRESFYSTLDPPIRSRAWGLAD